jgi:hypothetical protein
VSENVEALMIFVEMIPWTIYAVEIQQLGGKIRGATIKVFIIERFKTYYINKISLQEKEIAE